MEIKKFNSYSKLNEAFEPSGIVKQFIEEVTGEESLDDFKKATYEQINNLHRNASSSGIYYNDDYLIFTSFSTLKNWMYYAGYEYIDDQPQSINVNGEYLAIYNSQDHDRIYDDLERLNEEE